MTTLLVYRKAYERLRDKLESQVTCLVMDDDGACQMNGNAVELTEHTPDIAWANRDLYVSGPVREFMVACLKSPTLQWFQSSAAGFEHPVFGKLVANGVTLTNANASAVPIAEFVLAQVLDAFHPNQDRRAKQARKEWASTPFRDVAGSTWLVYGLGSIGKEVATRARAFGATVIGTRRSPVGDEPVDEMIQPADVVAHVGRADVVVLTAALNDSNRHIVGPDFVRAFRRDAVLVNVGRGGLVDEDALLQGLDNATPGTAILDVFEEEPLPASSPFWEHPRVRLTAHCAGASPGTSLRGDEIFLDNLSRFVSGEALANQVTELIPS